MVFGNKFKIKSVGTCVNYFLKSKTGVFKNVWKMEMLVSKRFWQSFGDYLAVGWMELEWQIE